MKKSLKHRVALAVGVAGLFFGSMAHAAPLASVAGVWNIIGNQHSGSLILGQGAGGVCKPIAGTIYPGVLNHPVRGYYCPSTGRLAFTRNNALGQPIQTWVGNVSDVVVGQPHRMGGTFHALDSGAGAGVLGEYHFQGQK
jgi:hypothetical protein